MSWFRRAREAESPVPAGATSQSYTLGAIEIGQPWARTAAPGGLEAAGFFTVANKGAAADRLIAASSTAAERIEIHAIKVVGAELRMGERAGGLLLSPGTTLTLKPRGYHLMLTGLRAPLEQGARLRIMLTFEKAGSIDIDFIVAPPGPIGLGAL